MFARVAAVSTPAASPADRATVDLAVSVATVRILKAARFGRVDPRTMKIDVGDDLLPFADYACLQGRALQGATMPGHRRWLQEHWRLHRTA